MRHHLFTPADIYSIALLIKNTCFNKQDLRTYYVHPLGEQGIPDSSIIAFTLQYNEAGKAPAKYIKDYLDELLPELKELGVTTLYVADANYFKVLTKQAKAEPHFGYVMPCGIKGYEYMRVVLGLNHQALIYNPDLQSKLDLSLKTLVSHIQGNYQVIGSSIIHSAEYLTGTKAIAAALSSLHQYPELTSDIETFSLKFDEAGVGTISFAWDEHHGIAFACDYPASLLQIAEPYCALKIPNHTVRDLLKQFFTEYKGKLVWHNSVYDLKVLIYTLWMRDPLDTEGLLEGLEVMTRLFDDTKIIAYLATNSTAGNVLKLKSLAHEFAGNWAIEEIDDIRLIPLDKLLQYNLVDALSTWYVHKKCYPLMVQDNQKELYNSIMLPSLKVIIQMELTGMPMDMDKVLEAKTSLQIAESDCLLVLSKSSVIQEFTLVIQQDAMEKANKKLKKKQHPLSAFSHVEFNPGSGPQVQKLLYEQMQLPVLDYTDTKLPATGGETLEKLINHTQNQEYKYILTALIGLSKVSKILTSFIPAFERALLKGDGVHWLHGCFNLGGTVSGRLSSSKPNLQNLPSGSDYGKLIKSCFRAPKGWIFCGADFNSLEDYISALTTKDPNKLKVYEGLNQFIVTVNGINHQINENTIIEYDGKLIKGKELYALLQNC